MIPRWVRGLFRRSEPPPPRSAIVEGWFERLLDESGFLRRYPQYAGVLARMDPIATHVVPVMAVALARWDDPSSRVQLLVNPEWLSESARFRAGVLLHEIQHVLLGHLSDPKFHAVHYPRLMELAMELSANEPITEPLPETRLELRRFERFGVRRGQSTMERYRLLADAWEDGRLELKDFWFARMLDTHRPRQCGASRSPGMGDLIDARSDGASDRNFRRGSFGFGWPSSEQELARMKRAIARHLRGERGGADDQLGGGQRRAAKELARVVMEVGGRRELDWRRVLRELLSARRRVRPDYRRPNRRFPERVGEIPGRARRPPKPALLVGIDTSGSMNGEALDRIARELRRLARHARLTLVECDAAVHAVYPMRAQLGPFTGGGDTDFAPFFEELRGAHPYEAVIYFTDGKGDMPPVPPALPTLWALTHDDPFHAEWGSIVRISD